MPLSIKDFEKLPSEPLHEEYVRKLREIGVRLGFDTTGLKTHLGVLDCVWRLKKDILPLPENNLPIVVFEVICSEEQKAIRGSTLNMIAAKPSLAVFVLVKKGITKKRFSDTTPQQWLRRVENFVTKIKQSFSGILRIAIWNEEDVDKLYASTIRAH